MPLPADSAHLFSKVDGLVTTWTGIFPTKLAPARVSLQGRGSLSLLVAGHIPAKHINTCHWYVQQILHCIIIQWNSLISWFDFSCSWTHEFVDFKLYAILLKWISILLGSCLDCPTHEIHEIKCPMNINDITVYLTLAWTKHAISFWTEFKDFTAIYRGFKSLVEEF